MGTSPQQMHQAAHAAAAQAAATQFWILSLRAAANAYAAALRGFGYGGNGMVAHAVSAIASSIGALGDQSTPAGTIPAGSFVDSMATY